MYRRQRSRHVQDYNGDRMAPRYRGLSHATITHGTVPEVDRQSCEWSWDQVDELNTSVSTAMNRAVGVDDNAVV